MKKMKINYFSLQIEELIGLECFYHGVDKDGIELPPTLVKIIGYEIEIEDKPPYDIHLRFQIEPIGEHCLDEDEVEYLRERGSHDIFLTFDNHF
jgi:hypothetical protein